MKRLFLFIGVVSLLNPSRILFSQVLSGKISIAIESRNTRFVTGEMMYFDGEIENLTDEVLTVNDPSSSQGLRIVLLDPERKPMFKALHAEFKGSPPTVALKPGSKKYFLINLLWYGHGKTRTGVGMSDFVPGSYSLSVELNGVVSNLLEFQVADRSVEEMRVFNTLNQHAAISMSDREGQIADCKLLIRSDHGSPYLPNVYCMLIYQLTTVGRYDDAMASAEEFLRKFPNHGAAEYAINYYQRAFFSSRGVSRSRLATEAELKEDKDQLQRLALNHPQSKVIGYAVEYYITSYERWWHSERAIR